VLRLWVRSARAMRLLHCMELRAFTCIESLHARGRRHYPKMMLVGF
jgi:hypothetical protein